MLNLLSVYDDPTKFKPMLYELLKERTPEQSISHREMPTYENHCKFVDKRPYPHWYMIEAEGAIVGSTYLTDRKEIGIFIFAKHHRKGYGKQAVLKMKEAFFDIELYANVNPVNEPSHALFQSIGGKIIQYTYVF